MLATTRWQVKLGREKDLCCSCERLLVGDTIGAKSEGWGNCDGNKKRIAGDQRSSRDLRAGHAAGDGEAAGGGHGGWSGMGRGGGVAVGFLGFVACGAY